MGEPEALAAWHPPHTGQRGRPRDDVDLAIETGHLLRLAFGQPRRQTERLLRSLVTLLGFDAGVPDHTTVSRRSPGLVLAASLAQAQASGPVHEVSDATGLTVYGASAWLVEKHGGRGTRTSSPLRGLPRRGIACGDGASCTERSAPAPASSSPPS